MEIVGSKAAPLMCHMSPLLMADNNGEALVVQRKVVLGSNCECAFAISAI